MKLDFVKGKSIVFDSAKIRPAMFRLDFLELEWLDPESLLARIDQEAREGNIVNEAGESVFSAAQTLHNIIIELKKVIPVKGSDLGSDFERTLATAPIEVTQDFIRELKREGRSYDAAQLLKAFHKSKNEAFHEGVRVNKNLSNKLWRIKKLKNYKEQSGNGHKYMNTRGV